MEKFTSPLYGKGPRKWPGALEASEYDAQAHDFLPGYIGEDRRFGDDRLDFGVHGGVVTIRGTVDSVEERRLLVHCVRRVPGVRGAAATTLRLSGL